MGTMMENFFGLGDNLLTEDASVIYNGPDPDSIAIVELLNKAIKEEFDAVDLYNNIAMVAEQMGIIDVVNLLNHINTEENSHIGLLQDVLKKFTENAYAIDEGREEASEFLTEGVHKIYVNGELKDEIESDNPIEDVDKKAYEYKQMNGVKEVRIVYADGSTNNMKVESLTESATFKVGDILEYSGLHGGQYTATVKKIKDSTMYVDTSWVAEDTGKTVTEQDSFTIEKDSQGHERIVVWDYYGEKGYVYPPSFEYEEFESTDETKEIKYQVTADISGLDDVYSEHTNLEDAIASAREAADSWFNVKIKDLRDGKSWLDIDNAEADLRDGLVTEDIEHVPNYNREIAAHLSTAYKAAREALDRYMKTGIISDVKAYSFIALSNIERAHELMNESQNEELLTEDKEVPSSAYQLMDKIVRSTNHRDYVVSKDWYGNPVLTCLITPTISDIDSRLCKELGFSLTKDSSSLQVSREYKDSNGCLIGINYDEDYESLYVSISGFGKESFEESIKLTESSEIDKLADSIEEEEGCKVLESEILREEPITSGDNRAWLLKFDLDNNETRYYVVSGFYWEIELETNDKQEAEDYFDGLVYNEEQEDY